MLASVTEKSASTETEHLFLLATTASAFKCVLVHLSSSPLDHICLWLSASLGAAAGEQVTISGTDGGGDRRAESTIPAFTRVRAGHPLQTHTCSSCKHSGLESRGVPGDL